MKTLTINDLHRSHELDAGAMESIAGRGFWGAIKSLGRELAFIGCNTLVTVTPASWLSKQTCNRHYGHKTKRRRDFRRQR